MLSEELHTEIKHFYKHVRTEESQDDCINPNLLGPLKLLNHNSLDGKSWCKKKRPLWVLGSDYKVVSPVFLHDIEPLLMS